ncbi:hypothetical protein DM860_002687 [Cuscuta australis]|uniref:Uncharacterized protein n=1 Tax=Cuscuta australis TaxID=267555 RepID=A0A328D2U7_9ASTE|nr:hypothetical protein DM860_002687 [Cuscuta australis]
MIGTTMTSLMTSPCNSGRNWKTTTLRRRTKLVFPFPNDIVHLHKSMNVCPQTSCSFMFGLMKDPTFFFSIKSYIILAFCPKKCLCYSRYTHLLHTSFVGFYWALFDEKSLVFYSFETWSYEFASTIQEVGKNTLYHASL